jgi:hypothetical protein
VGADLAGAAQRAATQDRHAGGDERHSAFAADRLPVALSAADSFPPRSTVYNIFASSSVTASGRRFGPSDRCRFGEKTFARASGNDSNAPIPVIRSNGAQLVHST